MKPKKKRNKRTPKKFKQTFRYLNKKETQEKKKKKRKKKKKKERKQTREK